MDGLHGELRRLGFAPGGCNRAMGAVPGEYGAVQEREVVTDPERQKVLALIAQAYNKGAVTLKQARELAEKV
jgi:hypothetical protein